MATRGEFAYLKSDGSVVSCYNHYDSYIDRLGKDLYREYNGDNIAIKAVDTAFGTYEKDDNDELCEFFSLETFTHHLENSDREYAYLWKDGQWFVSQNSDWHEWLPLADYFNNDGEGNG